MPSVLSSLLFQQQRNELFEGDLAAHEKPAAKGGRLASLEDKFVHVSRLLIDLLLEDASNPAASRPAIIITGKTSSFLLPETFTAALTTPTLHKWCGVCRTGFSGRFVVLDEDSCVLSGFTPEELTDESSSAVEQEFECLFDKNATFFRILIERILLDRSREQPFQEEKRAGGIRRYAGRFQYVPTQHARRDAAFVLVLGFSRLAVTFTK